MQTKSFAKPSLNRLRYYKQTKTLTNQGSGSGSDNTECTYTDYVCKAPILIFYTCIPAWMICDGKSDCADSSDERNCRVLRKGTVRFGPTDQPGRGQRQSLDPFYRAASKFFGLFLNHNS